jgi:hypothetical protein
LSGVSKAVEGHNHILETSGSGNSNMAFGLKFALRVAGLAEWVGCLVVRGVVKRVAVAIVEREWPHYMVRQHFYRRKGERHEILPIFRQPLINRDTCQE